MEKDDYDVIVCKIRKIAETIKEAEAIWSLFC